MKPEDRKRLKQHIEMIVGHKIPSNVVFCPNCEKDVECIHTAELYECKDCGEDFAKYIVSRKPANSDVSVTQNVLTDIKTGQSIENTNPDYYKQEIARLTALVERLKEDAERLAKYCQHIPMPDTTCWMSSSGAWNCNCGATEAFYIHRTLMKELEEK